MREFSKRSELRSQRTTLIAAALVGAVIIFIALMAPRYGSHSTMPDPDTTNAGPSVVQPVQPTTRPTP